MYDLIFNNGEKVVLFETCTEVTGLFKLTSNVSSSIGTTGRYRFYQGYAISERNIVLKFDVSKNIADIERRYFKQGQNYILSFGSRKLNTICELADLIYTSDYNSNPTLHIGLTAIDPMWYDADSFSENIAVIANEFEFPWNDTPELGLNFGYKLFTAETNFKNDGDISVGFTVRFVAKGPVKNLLFESLSTGQFIRINIDLIQGDEVVISSVAGDKYVKLNGENIFKNKDKDSNYFDLIIGDNFLRYEADENTSNLDVYLEYTPAYESAEVQ